MDRTVTSPHTKRLARRFVVVAQVACDLQEAGVAFQMLRIAERFLRGAVMTPRDRNDVGELIVATHHRLWNLQQLDGMETRRWLGAARSPMP